MYKKTVFKKTPELLVFPRVFHELPVKRFAITNEERSTNRGMLSCWLPYCTLAGMSIL
jgi:hypothetical protein